MKIYSVGYPWGDFLEGYGDYTIVDSPEELNTDEPSFMVLWGGADISPSIYGHENVMSHPSPNRDKVEVPITKRAIELGIPILGICRGAQMLCGVAGGYLVQHLDNHGSGHDVITPDGFEFRVNSLHHQMMAGLEKVSHELLAWTKDKRSKVYLADTTVPEDIKEVEAVYFPEVKGLAIQWHPEMMATDSTASKFVFQNIDKYLIIEDNNHG